MMMATGRPGLIEYALASLARDPGLSNLSFNGRALLHHACGAGCLPVVKMLLCTGTDPNLLDSGGHAPLYRAASCRGTDAEAAVRELIKAGAKVSHHGGKSRA